LTERNLHRGALLPERCIGILSGSIFIFLGVFVFFNPFPHTTAIKEVGFYLPLVLAIVLVATRSVRFSFASPLTVPFLLFTLWAFVGLFFATYKEASVHDFILHWLKYLAFYYLLVNFFDSRKKLVILSWIIIVSAALFSIGGIIEFYWIEGHRFPKTLVNFLENSTNTIGFVTLFAILLSIHFLSRVRKLYEKLFLVVSLAGTSAMSILTQCRATILAIFVSLLILFPRNKKVMAMFLVILVIALAFMPVKNRLTFDALERKIHAGARLKIWYTNFEMFKDHPVMGTGFALGRLWHDEEVWKAYSEKVPPKWRIKLMHEPHNMFISIAVRLGIVGLGLFCYILYSFSRMCWIVVRRGRDDFIRSLGLCLTAAFIGYMIKGIFEEALTHIAAITFFTIFAMITVLFRMNAESETNDESKDDR